MTIDVYSFDFDGCLFNYYYLSSKERDLVASNRDLFKIINESKNKKLSYINSNRQSIEDDDTNAGKDERGSCYTAIETVNKLISSEFRPLLLTDIHHNFEAGTSYKQALKYINKDTGLYIEQKIKKNKSSLPNWLHDTSKLTVIYAQMHDAALLNPNEPIEFHFLDDREDILKNLHDYFSKYPGEIPPNVTLRLQRYMGPFNDQGQPNIPLISEYPPIKGTRLEADKHYRQTIKNMVGVTIEGLMKIGQELINKLGKPILNYKQAEEANFDLSPINCLKFYTPGMMPVHPVSPPAPEPFKIKLPSFGSLFRSAKTSTSEPGSVSETPIELTAISSSKSTPDLRVILEEPSPSPATPAAVRKPGSFFIRPTAPTSDRSSGEAVKMSSHRNSKITDEDESDEITSVLKTEEPKTPDDKSDSNSSKKSANLF